MTAPVLTFFNNKGGVGKTSLLYHLAWTFEKMGKRVIVADIDPQSNLTVAFLDEEQVNEIWTQEEEGSTIYTCVKPIQGVHDIVSPKLRKITSNLHLIPGDIALSTFEDSLSSAWPNSLGDSSLYRPLRIISSFWHIMHEASRQVDADLVLVDIGPNLGAINRSVLIATDYVIIPLGADLFSLQGLKNLGPTLDSWRTNWEKRLNNWTNNQESKSNQGFSLPGGKMKPIGYLCQQHSVRMDRPVKAYDKWVNRIPHVYREVILNNNRSNDTPIQTEDEYCLATIKHYRSLIPMAQEKRKPIFDLTPSDGAIGSHATSARDAEKDFKALAYKIADKINMDCD